VPRVNLTARPQKPLFKARDHGASVALDPEAFAPLQRGGGWGTSLEAFLRMNESTLNALDVRVQLAPAESGTKLSLVPGGRAGAVPLRSAVTGHVVGGFLVEPRFGWAGVGRVLSQTGWHSGPDFIDGPLVPGSGREVPPWVLAGPVLGRLANLLATLRRGYQVCEEVTQHPRGQIAWGRYINESLVRGRWANLPCRHPELASDPRIRQIVRWGVERIRLALLAVGGRDPIARMLVAFAEGLLQRLRDVRSEPPRRAEIGRLSANDLVLNTALARGFEALGWVVDERGLGGGRELDGIAWTLPLEQLWENYVEAIVREEAASNGGIVRVGRRRETVFPVEWSDPSHRSLGHLVPDVVVFRRESVHVIDAKYKAHLSELDEHGWQRFTEDARESHRADIHQVLAYASLYAANEVRASLIYPLRQSTFEALRSRGRDRSCAQLLHGARRVHLELRGIPFGSQERQATVQRVHDG
jgi:hypothetical protein